MRLEASSRAFSTPRATFKEIFQRRARLATEVARNLRNLQRRLEGSVLEGRVGIPDKGTLGTRIRNSVQIPGFPEIRKNCEKMTNSRSPCRLMECASLGLRLLFAFFLGTLEGEEVFMSSTKVLSEL